MKTTIKIKNRTLEVFRNRDEKGKILTYMLLDYNDRSLIGYLWKEFNSLKELNKFIKKSK